ncbi:MULTISPECIES: hypothetical protein [Mesorhizobium]|uniref:Lipoprotein n=1 Tax=Mesorhizobium denitrificans TaxID=2294114 RepID=A0A371XF97_9HYPH|nr:MULTISPECIES: hypothetical protein [Mesorhizobium]RFC67899.1 hypothetical protein DY251_09975 [Mesorhizobium denitrificans]
MTRISQAIAFSLICILPGCATSPTDYVAGLSQQDPKWQTPECEKMRKAALDYDAGEQRIYWSAGAVLGPYGLGLAAAGKEHQAKERKQLDREIHLQCSSQPFPKELQGTNP